MRVNPFLHISPNNILDIPNFSIYLVTHTACLLHIAKMRVLLGKSTQRRIRTLESSHQPLLLADTYSYLGR